MKRKHSITGCICAFTIPVAAMLLIYFFVGITPFGDKSVLSIDLHNQYIHYFSYLKEIIKGNHDIFYTFSKTIGGDMAGFTAYYLMSPLNLLLMLFPRDALQYGVELITLIKLGLCGLTFSLFLESRGAGKEGLIFSTGYALMAYNVAYQIDLMWLDVVVLLPLVVWGIHRIFEKRSPFFYLTSLFFSIMLNYYIGYMVCIFSALYFLTLFFLGEKREKSQSRSILGNYVASSLLSGGLAMFLLLPVLKSLLGGKASFDLSNLTMTRNFHLTYLPVKLFIGSFDYVQIQVGLPLIYCGFVCLFFVGVFFCGRSIAKKEKLRVGILLVCLVVSFYIRAFNLIWHGFNAPVWFPYRYSFLFSFLLLFSGWEGFCAAKQYSRKRLVLISAGIVLLLSAVAVWMYTKNFDFMSGGQYIGSILVLLAAGVVCLLCMKKYRSAATWLLLVLCVGELCVNGTTMVSRLSHTEDSKYREFVQRTEPAVQYVKDLDDGFYRMEKMYFLTRNDPMLFDYRGLSHYCSTEKQLVKYFVGRMGFRSRGIWAQYGEGSTYAADSFFGLKYILSDDPKDVVPYPLLDTVGDIRICQNPYALPIGFCTDEAVMRWDIYNTHVFETQNKLWASMCPEDGRDIFVEEPTVDVSLKNVEQKADDPGIYAVIDPNQKASITYTFTAVDENPVFVYFATDELHKVKLSVNGEARGTYFHKERYDVIRLGAFEKGQKVKVKLRLLDEYVKITDAWFYRQDMDVFEDYFEKLNDETFEVEKASDSYIRGTVENHSQKRQRLFFTIPCEDGWHVYIDGQRVPIAPGAGIFLTTEISEGEHRVELWYVPPGLKKGLFVSAGSLALLVLWIILRKRARRMRKNAEI